MSREVERLAKELHQSPLRLVQFGDLNLLLPKLTGEKVDLFHCQLQEWYGDKSSQIILFLKRIIASHIAAALKMENNDSPLEKIEKRFAAFAKIHDMVPVRDYFLQMTAEQKFVLSYVLASIEEESFQQQYPFCRPFPQKSSL